MNSFESPAKDTRGCPNRSCLVLGKIMDRICKKSCVKYEESREKVFPFACLRRLCLTRASRDCSWSSWLVDRIDRICMSARFFAYRGSSYLILSKISWSMGQGRVYCLGGLIGAMAFGSGIC
jgi:hypothetical protein